MNNNLIFEGDLNISNFRISLKHFKEFEKLNLEFNGDIYQFLKESSESFNSFEEIEKKFEFFSILYLMLSVFLWKAGDEESKIEIEKNFFKKFNVKIEHFENHLSQESMGFFKSYDIIKLSILWTKCSV